MDIDKPARQATVRHIHPMDTWTLTLNRYQRNNLLLLLNTCGYPYGNPHYRESMDFNTGDWIGEIANMLAKIENEYSLASTNVINDHDRVNPPPKRLEL